MRAKGPDSIRITKVKGHATQDQVNSNIYKQCDKDGNDKADKAADIAVKLHGEDLIEIARQMAYRIKDYTKFMGLVAKHIIEAYLIHRKLIEHEQNTKPKEPKHIYYTSNPISTSSQGISNPSAAGFQKLDVTGDIHSFVKYHDKHKAGANICDFLKQLRCRSPGQANQATTWLELYILYRLYGYDKPVPDKGNKAAAKASTDQQLAQFATSVRGCVSRTMYRESHIAFFKPYKNNIHKYKCLGIEGMYPTISAEIHMTEDQRTNVELHIIRLAHHISDKKVQAFKNGEIGLPFNKIKLSGKVLWESRLAPKYTPIQSPAPISDHTTGYTYQGEALFNCPRCDHIILSTSINSQDLDNTSKCSQCKSNVKAKDWKCKCKMPWHTCNFHRSSITNNITTKSDARSTTTTNKRLIGPLTHEELVNIDIKRRRRDPAILLLPAPNLMSANLRARFPHIC